MNTPTHFFVEHISGVGSGTERYYVHLFEIFLFQAETNDNMGLSLSVEPSEAISLQLLLRTHKTKPSIVPGFQSCCGSPLFSTALGLAFLKSMLQ